MTYDRQSTYLTWGGTIGGSGIDGWQCGVHLTPPAAGGSAMLPGQSMLDTLLNGAIKTFHTSAGAAIALPCLLTWAKAALLGLDGKYLLESTYSTVTPAPGAKAAPYTGGPQLSGVVTLWSGGTLGQANYGRFYVPWWEAAVDSSARVIAPAIADFQAAALVLVNGINSWSVANLGAGYRIRIMSKLGGGTTKDATKLRVGNVKDTQQRRRRQLTETYTTVAIT
jgi:hypothetical protein